MKESQVRCPYCQQISNIIFVHGHGQCSKCGVNIDECCNGEVCNAVEEEDLKTKNSNQNKS